LLSLAVNLVGAMAFSPCLVRLVVIYFEELPDPSKAVGVVEGGWQLFLVRERSASPPLEDLAPLNLGLMLLRIVGDVGASEGGGALGMRAVKGIGDSP
jgi:hypothetical protein